MKRILFVIGFAGVFAGAVFASGSAIDKGSKMLKGNFRVSSLGGDAYTMNPYKSRVVNIHAEPVFAWFAARGLSIGVAFSMDKLTYDYDSMTLWGFGPRIDYFLAKGKPKEGAVNRCFYPYVSLSAQYQESFGQKGLASESWKRGATTAGGAGILQMIGNSVGVSLEMSYFLGFQFAGGDVKKRSEGLNATIGLNVFDF
jgi:hypothetical protein